MTIDEAVKKIGHFIDDYVTAYKEDWTKHDLPRLKKCRPHDSFLVAVRTTGVDTLLITGPQKSYSNQLWAEASVSQNYSDAMFWFYNGESRELRNVDHKKAMEICKKSKDMLNKEYIKYCVKLWEDRISALNEQEWLRKEERNYG